MNLTQEQIAAVRSDTPASCVIAGAGAGKTAVIVERVRHLVENGAPPQSIAVVTFTRKAAEEIIGRLKAADERLGDCIVGTFHSVAYDLMPHKPTVLSEEESAKMLAECCHSLGADKKVAKMSYQYRIMQAIGEPQKELPAVDLYLSRMSVDGQLDYLGLLIWLMENTGKVWLSNIIVDEAQDNEPLQWEILRRFVAQGADFFCVMDPRQMIYGWRGADYSMVSSIAPAEYLLTKSFRNPRDVIKLANAIASDVHPELPPLEAHSENDGLMLTAKEIGWVIEQLAMELFMPEDIAVLCRTNETVSRMKEQLTAAGYPVAESTTKTKRLEPLIRYLANPGASNPGVDDLRVDIMEPSVLSENDDADMVRDLKLSIWLGRTDGTIRDILSQIIFLDDELNEEVSWWNNYFGSRSIKETSSRMALFTRETEATSGIRVMTTHQAKGLEFPAVVIAPERFIRDSDEERRLAYVQVTRPTQRLVVMDHGNTPGYLQRLTRKIILGSLHQDTLAYTLAAPNGDGSDGIDNRQEDSSGLAPAYA